jgi:TonB family protein
MRIRLLLTALLLAPIAVRAQETTPPAEAVTNCVLVSAVAPTYPRSHFKNPERAVLVGLTVNIDGVPENVHIVRTGGDRFDKNALATVAQYKFKPALKSGQPVAQDIQIEVSYKVPH